MFFFAWIKAVKTKNYPWTTTKRYDMDIKMSWVYGIGTLDFGPGLSCTLVTWSLIFDCEWEPQFSILQWKIAAVVITSVHRVIRKASYFYKHKKMLSSSELFLRVMSARTSICWQMKFQVNIFLKYINFHATINNWQCTSSIKAQVSAINWRGFLVLTRNPNIPIRLWIPEINQNKTYRQMIAGSLRTINSLVYSWAGAHSLPSRPRCYHNMFT